MDIRQSFVDLLDDFHLLLLRLPGTQAHCILRQQCGADALTAARPFAQEGTHALDHLCRMLGMTGNTLKSLGQTPARLATRLQRRQIALTGGGVIDDGGQRLVDFMGDTGGQLTERRQSRGMCQLILQTAAVLFTANTFGNIPRHTDNLHHLAGIGLPYCPAGGFKPQIVAVAVADPVTDGQIAVLLKRAVIALPDLVPLLGMEQIVDLRTTQLLRPSAKQRPGRRGSIQKRAFGRMPGNQIRGVLDDQPVQTPSDHCLLLIVQRLGSVSGTGQYPVAGHRNEGPQQMSLTGRLHGHLTDSPLLAERCRYQLRMVVGQQNIRRITRSEQIVHGRVPTAHPAAGIEQARRLRISSLQQGGMPLIRHDFIRHQITL